MGGRLRVEVLTELCRGYANCLDAAPDVFDLDDEDIAFVLAEDYPADQREHLDNAARRCPAKAIIIHESEKPQE